MSILKSLFGSRAGRQKAEQVQYQGYTIQPCPQNRGQGWTTEAVITLEREGQTLTHHLIRADTASDREGAARLAVSKAQRLIDEAGEKLFRK